MPARDRRLAAYAMMVGAGFAASDKMKADIVYSGPVSIAIPVTSAGVYLNVITGATGFSSAGTPGWDVNPWSATTLNFFNPSTPSGGVYVTGGGSSATLVDNLGLGTLVSGASVFGSGMAETTGSTAFSLNSPNNFVGFRFLNEATGIVNYGWLQISLGASLTDPARAIVGYAYENTGGAILTPIDLPAPEPSSFALLGMMAAGAIGVRAWRRRRGA
ncbi:MAG: hypothetical protein ABI946_07305 [Chthoniobacterales bacterium]